MTIKLVETSFTEKKIINYLIKFSAYLYKADWYGLFRFAIMSCYFIYCFRDVFQHQIQVHLILLLRKKKTIKSS